MVVWLLMICYIHEVINKIPSLQAYNFVVLKYHFLYHIPLKNPKNEDEYLLYLSFCIDAKLQKVKKAFFLEIVYGIWKSLATRPLGFWKLLRVVSVSSHSEMVNVYHIYLGHPRLELNTFYRILVYTDDTPENRHNKVYFFYN